MNQLEWPQPVQELIRAAEAAFRRLDSLDGPLGSKEVTQLRHALQGVGVVVQGEWEEMAGSSAARADQPNDS